MAKLDEKVQDFLKRPILNEFRYVWFDASYYSIRTNGRYMNRPLLLAIGADCYGQWKVIGAKLAFSENEESWKLFMREAARDTFGSDSRYGFSG